MRPMAGLLPMQEDLRNARSVWSACASAPLSKACRPVQTAQIGTARYANRTAIPGWKFASSITENSCKGRVPSCLKPFLPSALSRLRSSTPFRSNLVRPSRTLSNLVKPILEKICFPTRPGFPPPGKKSSFAKQTQFSMQLLCALCASVAKNKPKTNRHKPLLSHAQKMQTPKEAAHDLPPHKN